MLQVADLHDYCLLPHEKLRLERFCGSLDNFTIDKFAQQCNYRAPQFSISRKSLTFEVSSTDGERGYCCMIVAREAIKSRLAKRQTLQDAPMSAVTDDISWPPSESGFSISCWINISVTESSKLESGTDFVLFEIKEIQISGTIFTFTFWVDSNQFLKVVMRSSSSTAPPSPICEVTFQEMQPISLESWHHVSLSFGVEGQSSAFLSVSVDDLQSHFHPFSFDAWAKRRPAKSDTIISFGIRRDSDCNIQGGFEDKLRKEDIDETSSQNNSQRMKFQISSLLLLNTPLNRSQIVLLRSCGPHYEGQNSAEKVPIDLEMCTPSILSNTLVTWHRESVRLDEDWITNSRVNVKSGKSSQGKMIPSPRVSSKGKVDGSESLVKSSPACSLEYFKQLSMIKSMEVLLGIPSNRIMLSLSPRWTYGPSCSYNVLSGASISSISATHESSDSNRSNSGSSSIYCVVNGRKLLVKLDAAAAHSDHATSIDAADPLDPTGSSVHCTRFPSPGSLQSSLSLELMLGLLHRLSSCEGASALGGDNVKSVAAIAGSLRAAPLFRKFMWSQQSHFYGLCLSHIVEGKGATAGVLAQPSPSVVAIEFARALLNLCIDYSRLVTTHADLRSLWACLKSVNMPSLGLDPYLPAAWVVDSRLLYLIVTNSVMWRNAAPATFASCMMDIRAQLLQPFGSFHQVNKQQLTRAQFLRSLVTILLDPHIPLDFFESLADSMEDLFLGDFVNLEDFHYFVRVLVAFTVTPVASAASSNAAVDEYGRPLSVSAKLTSMSSPAGKSTTSSVSSSSVRRRSSKSSKQSSQKSLKGLILNGLLAGAGLRRTKKVLLSSELEVAKIDSLEIIRRNPERLRKVRHVLAIIILQAASWYSIFASRAIATSSGSGAGGSSASVSGRGISGFVGEAGGSSSKEDAFRIRRGSTDSTSSAGVPGAKAASGHMKPFLSSQASVSSQASSTIESDFLSEPTFLNAGGAGIAAPGGIDGVGVGETGTPEQFVQLSSILYAAGTKGMSFLITSLPLSHLLNLLFQYSDLTPVSTSQQAARSGALRSTQRRKDPFTGLLIFQILTVLMPFYPGGLRKSQWVKEIELYLPGLLQVLLVSPVPVAANLHTTTAATSATGTGTLNTDTAGNMSEESQAKHSSSPRDNETRQSTEFISILRGWQWDYDRCRNEGEAEGTPPEELIFSAVDKTNFYYRMASEGLQFGSATFPTATGAATGTATGSPISAEEDAYKRPLQLYLETLFDMLFGGPKTSERIFDSLLQPWKLDKLEPVFVPPVQSPQPTNAAAGLPPGAASPGAAPLYRLVDCSTVRMVFPQMLSTVLEVARVAALRSTLEAFELYQYSIAQATGTRTMRGAGGGIGGTMGGNSTERLELARRGYESAQSMAVTIMCAVSSLYRLSESFRAQLKAAKYSGGSSSASGGSAGGSAGGGSSATAKGKTFEDDLLVGIVQVFYAAANSNLVTVLMKGCFSDERSPTGAATTTSTSDSASAADRSQEQAGVVTDSSAASFDEVDRASIGRMSSTLNPLSVSSPLFGRTPGTGGGAGGGAEAWEDLEPEEDEWNALPNEVVYRACGNTVGRLCLQLITTIATQQLLEEDAKNAAAQSSPSKTSSSLSSSSPTASGGGLNLATYGHCDFSVNSNWAVAVSTPPVACFPTMPESVRALVAFSLNSATRRRIVQACSDWIQAKYYARQIEIYHQLESVIAEASLPSVSQPPNRRMSIKMPEVLQKAAEAAESGAATVAAAAPAVESSGSPLSYTMDKSIDSQSPFSPSPVRSSQVSNNSNSNAGTTTLYDFGGQLMLSIGELLKQMSELELGQSLLQDDFLSNPDGRIVRSLGIAMDLIRNLRKSISSIQEMQGDIAQVATQVAAAKAAAAPSMDAKSSEPVKRKLFSSMFYGNKTPQELPASTSSSSSSSFGGKSSSGMSMLGKIAGVFVRKKAMVDVDREFEQMYTGLSLAILSIRRSVVTLIETHRNGDHLLALKAIEFLTSNSDLLLGKDLHMEDFLKSYREGGMSSHLVKLGTPVSVTMSIARTQKRRVGLAFWQWDLDFTAALSAELFSLLLEDDDKVRNYAIECWALLMTSPLMSIARKLFQLERGEVEGYDQPLDLWIHQGSGFSIVLNRQQVTVATDSCTNGSISTSVSASPVTHGLSASDDRDDGVIRTTAAAAAVTASPTTISPSIQFYAWFGSLPELFRNSLQDKLDALSVSFKDMWIEESNDGRDAAIRRMADDVSESTEGGGGSSSVVALGKNITSGLKAGLSVGLRVLGRKKLAYDLPMVASHRLRWDKRRDDHNKLQLWLLEYLTGEHAQRRREARALQLAHREWERLHERNRTRLRHFGKKRTECLARILSNLTADYLYRSSLRNGGGRGGGDGNGSVAIFLGQQRPAPDLFMHSFSPTVPSSTSIVKSSQSLRPLPWFRSRLGLALMGIQDTATVAPAVRSYSSAAPRQEFIVASSSGVMVSSAESSSGLGTSSGFGTSSGLCFDTEAAASADGLVIGPELTLSPPETEGDFGTLEAGTDGTIMAVAALLRVENKGEWGLSTEEGPGRLRRKIRRGNLVLLRVKDPSQQTSAALRLAVAASAAAPATVVKNLSNAFASDDQPEIEDDDDDEKVNARIDASTKALASLLSISSTSVARRGKREGEGEGEEDEEDGDDDGGSAREHDATLNSGTGMEGIESPSQDSYYSTSAISPATKDRVNRHGLAFMDGTESFKRRERRSRSGSSVQSTDDSLASGSSLNEDEDDQLDGDECSEGGLGRPHSTRGEGDDGDELSVGSQEEEEEEDDLGSAGSVDEDELGGDYVDDGYVDGNLDGSDDAGYEDAVEEAAAAVAAVAAAESPLVPTGAIEVSAPAAGPSPLHSSTTGLTVAVDGLPNLVAPTPVSIRRRDSIRTGGAGMTTSMALAAAAAGGVGATGVRAIEESELVQQIVFPSDSVSVSFYCYEVMGMENSSRLCYIAAQRFYVISTDSIPGFQPNPSRASISEQQLARRRPSGHIASNVGASAMRGNSSSVFGAMGAAGGDAEGGEGGGDQSRKIIGGEDRLMEVWLPRKSSRARKQTTGTSGAGFITGYQGEVPALSVSSRDTRMWGYSDILSVQRRRYLLVDRAIEIFFRTKQSSLLIFTTTAVRETVLAQLLEKCSPLARPVPLPPSPSSSVSSISLGMSHTAVALDPLTALWCEGVITNFDYLMYLNTLAGRSNNDWTCYPVFPWVLSDYHSEYLDLDNPAVYRDLSRPMGAISRVREKAARQRHSTLIELAMMNAEGGDMDSPGLDSSPHRVTTTDRLMTLGGGEARAKARAKAKAREESARQAYHYGTHYSTSAVVLHYMVRLQPFSSHSIALQVGRFDRPDRLFRSIRDSWLSASGGVTVDPATATDNLQDVKELTPEFFYLPDFLCNINGYEMGFASVRSSKSIRSSDEEEEEKLGRRVGEVELPPWAKGNPREFIRLHRAALESDYVSAHLNDWLDLIFGYKQRGAAAEQACNLFHFLTYSGFVDVSAINSPLTKEAYEQQIRDFGQTPEQLFKKPHPRRRFRIQPPGTSQTLPAGAKGRRATSSSFGSASSLEPKQNTSTNASTSSGGVVGGGVGESGYDAFAPLAQPQGDFSSIGGGYGGSGAGTPPLPGSSPSMALSPLGQSLAAISRASSLASTGSGQQQQQQQQRVRCLSESLGGSLFAAMGATPAEAVAVELESLLWSGESSHVHVVTVSDTLLATIGPRPLLSSHSFHSSSGGSSGSSGGLGGEGKQRSEAGSARSVSSDDSGASYLSSVEPSTASGETDTDTDTTHTGKASAATSTSSAGIFKKLQHRSINDIRVLNCSLNASDDVVRGASAGCILLPPYEDRILATGFLDATLKLIELDDDEWRVTHTLDTDGSGVGGGLGGSGAVCSAAGVSEDGLVLVTALDPGGAIQVWRLTSSLADPTVAVDSSVSSESMGAGPGLSSSQYLGGVSSGGSSGSGAAVTSAAGGAGGGGGGGGGTGTAGASMKGSTNTVTVIGGGHGIAGAASIAGSNSRTTTDNSATPTAASDEGDSSRRGFPYMLLQRALGDTFHGASTVTAVKVSSAHNIFVTGCAGGRAVLWDLQSLVGIELDLLVVRNDKGKGKGKGTENDVTTVAADPHDSEVMKPLEESFPGCIEPTTSEPHPGSVQGNESLSMAWRLLAMERQRKAAEANQRHRVWNIDIDAVTGSVFVAFGKFVRVFDVNGRRLFTADVCSLALEAANNSNSSNNIKVNNTVASASVSTSASASGSTIGSAHATPSRRGSRGVERKDVEVLCVRCCPVAEWMRGRGFIAGCSDGSIRLWKFEIDVDDDVPDTTAFHATTNSNYSPATSTSSGGNSSDIDGGSGGGGKDVMRADEVMRISYAFGGAAVTAISAVSTGLYAGPGAVAIALYAGSEEGTISRWELVTHDC